MLVYSRFVIPLLLETKQQNMKELVRLRKKALQQGGYSLYLDIYLNGVRKYEFLKLYLVDEKTRQDKQANKETMRIAETVKAQRIVDIERGNFNLLKSSSETVVNWYISEIERKKREGMMYSNLQNTLPLVRSYFDQIKLKDLTREHIIKFKEFILNIKNIKKSTKKTYFASFKAAINQAVKLGKVKTDVMVMVGELPAAETHREFLTMEEVKILAASECKKPILKRAFLFSCLTGLRYIDITRLTWANVSVIDGFTRLTFTQKKTGGHEYLDISNQAVPLMGKRGADHDFIFKNFRYNSRISRELTQWVNSVGINKKISFHCARHTFAIMMLELGVNIAVIQKLLGHKTLATTLVYAKVLDKSKREAVTLIPNLII